jgi:actin related protein 2/3 complex, subunit 2
MGSKDIIDRVYPGCFVPPVQGFNVAIRFNCDNLPGDAQQFLNAVSELRRNVMAGPLERAFNALQAKTSNNLATMTVEYRPSEPMFICPTEGKIIVTFAIDFADVTDKALARVFLQEFVEAQRLVRNAPPVSFSRDVPPTLSRVSYAHKANLAGFISFAVEERHVAGAGKDKVITLLTGFRNYLHYHIKCSKTYLHMRMRKKVNGWMQVLNRAMPDVETEKKTSSGKTFVRK